MTKAEYLLTLKLTPEKIRDTWVALGQLTCTNQTKVYLKDAIYQINNENAPTNGSLIYCNYEYRAESAEDLIEWEQMNPNTLDGIVSFMDGIQAPHFTWLLTKEELDSISVDVNPSYIPFAEMQSAQTDILIPDEEINIMLTEVGVPFLRIEELEYSRNQIINYFIKPMLDIYWKFFPHVEQEVLGSFGANQAFEKEMPKYAYNAVPYYTIGANGGTPVSSFGQGAFALAREQMYLGMGAGYGGSRFGRGITYRKMVPGYVGNLDYISQSTNTMATAQGTLNMFRREAFQKVHKDGKLYITGFTTIGGTLNVKWLMNPPDWNLIEFEDLPDVRNLCKANILMNFGALREMARADIPGALDFGSMKTRGEKLYEEVLDKWNKSSTNYMHAIMRGGLN